MVGYVKKTDHGNMASFGQTKDHRKITWKHQTILVISYVLKISSIVSEIHRDRQLNKLLDTAGNSSNQNNMRCLFINQIV